MMMLDRMSAAELAYIEVNGSELAPEIDRIYHLYLKDLCPATYTSTVNAAIHLSSSESK